MAKKDDETLLETEDQEAVVVITDEKGNETYYLEEMVIPMDRPVTTMVTVWSSMLPVATPETSAVWANWPTTSRSTPP